MKPVLVTTAHRGVFFGNLVGKASKEELTLKNARNCIYWSSDCGGFLGLVSKGPTKDCRIGALVPEITLYDITSVTPVPDNSAKVWLDAKTYGA